MAKQTTQSEAEIEADKMIEWWAVSKSVADGVTISETEKTKLKKVFARGYETALSRRRQSSPFVALAKIKIALERYKDVPGAISLATHALITNDIK